MGLGAMNSPCFPPLKQSLSEKNIACPGMPAGSPGMPSPTPERYDVIAFGGDQEQVFMSFIETDPV